MCSIYLFCCMILRVAHLKIIIDRLMAFIREGNFKGYKKKGL